jgi:hypothetical protein
MLQQSDLLITISKNLKDENLYKQAQYHIGNANYAIQNYGQTLEQFKTGFSANLTTMEKVIALSSALISSATTKNQESFTYFKLKAQQTLAECESFEATTMYGGIARAEAILGHNCESVKNYEQAQIQNNINVAKRGPQHILKTIQLRRNQLEISGNCKGTFSKNALEKVCQEAVTLARQFGYIRYANQITSYLAEF